MYLVLYLFWVILNGKFTLEIALLGLAVTAGIGWLCVPLFHYTPRKELWLYRKAPILAAYCVVVIWEIIKANFVMFSIILHKTRKVQPCLLTFSVDLKTSFARFLLANSITLTPGTLTVEIEGNVFRVHCIGRDLMENTTNSKIVRLLRKLEA